MPRYYFYPWIIGLVYLLSTVSGVAAQSFDFAFQMSGDRRIAPVQVFHDGQQTYLQFREDQPTPAIIARGTSNALLSYTKQAPYVIVPGVYPTLELQLYGNYAHIQYMGNASAPTGSPAYGAPGAVPYPSAHSPSPLSHPSTIPSHVPAGSVNYPVPQAQGQFPAYPSPPPAPLSPRPTPGASGFQITPGDKNFRSALKKWAQTAGWTFDNEHWTVAFDIPISASAQFSGDFRQAVRGLLSSTELTEHPLQPCFYSNQVIRVIRWIESCDPKGVRS